MKRLFKISFLFFKKMSFATFNLGFQEITDQNLFVLRFPV